jgi:hypothetical protein
MRAADGVTAVGPAAIDELLERYICWREDCQAVRQAYQRWAASHPDERGLAHTGYLAALDREERAAGIYAVHIKRLEHSSVISRNRAACSR